MVVAMALQRHDRMPLGLLHGRCHLRSAAFTRLRSYNQRIIERCIACTSVQPPATVARDAGGYGRTI